MRNQKTRTNTVKYIFGNSCSSSSWQRAFKYIRVCVCVCVQRRWKRVVIDFDKREVFCHILKSWSLGFRCCDDPSGRMRDIGSYLVSNPTLPGRLRKCLKGKRFSSIITEIFSERLTKRFVEKGLRELSRGRYRCTWLSFNHKFTIHVNVNVNQKLSNVKGTTRYHWSLPFIIWTIFYSIIINILFLIVCMYVHR